MLHLNPKEPWACQRMTFARVLDVARKCYAQAESGAARRLALVHQTKLLIRIDRLTQY